MGQAIVPRLLAAGHTVTGGTAPLSALRSRTQPDTLLNFPAVEDIYERA